MSSPDPRAGSHYQVEGVDFFVLIGSQRSGTNFLREVLNTSQQTVVHGEVLWPYPLPNCWHNYVRTMVSRAMPPIYEADAVALFDDYLVYLREDVKRGYPGKLGALRAVGLDVKYNQLRFIAPLIRDLREGPFLLDYCGQRRVQVIHMLRRNVIHQALSLVIAQARNVYHNYGHKKFEGRLEIDPESLLASARWLTAEIETFRKMGRGAPRIDVYYEDVVEDCKKADASGRMGKNAKTMAMIAEFLGVPNEFSNPSTITKVINRPYAEILSNHDKVVAAVKGSEFAGFAKTL